MAKRKSYAQLDHELKAALATIENMREQSGYWKLKLAAEQKLNERVDTTMLDARTKLASQLGQMMDATSHAIRFLVAGERGA